MVAEKVISALVPSRSDGNLSVLLNSLEASEIGSAGRVIVGDNGLSKSFRTSWQRPTYVDVPKPFVFAQAINRCAAAAPDANDLLVLGDDTRIVTPWWAESIEALLASPTRFGFGLISLQVRGRGGIVEAEEASRGLWKPWGVFESRWTVCFNAVIIPRAVWNLIGPMDERYVGYGHDDDDYNLRVWHAGYRVGMCRAAMVCHTDASSYAASLPGMDWERQYDLNAQLFQEKWSITIVGRKGLSCADDHRRCREHPWHAMPD